MGIENFIRDALHQPNDYVPYHVARELAELHPGKTILEGRNWEFDLDAFVRADGAGRSASAPRIRVIRTILQKTYAGVKGQRTRCAWLFSA